MARPGSIPPFYFRVHRPQSRCSLIKTLYAVFQRHTARKRDPGLLIPSCLNMRPPYAVAREVRLANYTAQMTRGGKPKRLSYTQRFSHHDCDQGPAFLRGAQFARHNIS